MLDGHVGFIGAGQMARALARGLVGRNLVKPKQVLAYDPVPAALQQFLDAVPGAKSAGDNRGVVREAGVVVLAVKPQSLPAVCQSLDGESTSGKLFISILAGVSLRTLRQELRTERVVRVMPNTPCLIGQGASAFSNDPPTDPRDMETVTQLLSAVGQVFPLSEQQLDAVTGLSGSGPAYVYLMIEALSDGGVRMGLPRSVATALAAQTVAGAAQMVLQTGEHPSVLKDQVTSPGGTTIAGLKALERGGVRAALGDAVEAATIRSRELGAPGK
jgi:pyrroline-5-carboxylate reductase